MRANTTYVRLATVGAQLLRRHTEQAAGLPATLLADLKLPC